MEKIFFRKGIGIGIIFIFIFLNLTFASAEDVVNYQGKIMELDLKKNIMVVNEKLFVWNEKTIINNEKGSLITINKFKPKSWVYIEGESDKINKRIIIKKIYLLPKYIDKKDRHLYPFME